MEIPNSEAKAHLADLVRRAEAGGDMVLTRRGLPVAKLAPIDQRPRSVEERRAFLQRLRAEAMRKVTAGPDASRSQDFLYDEFGMPK
ncbi:MAG TPA: type II toxin-antitoxin system prevent-host-death family antitoxin [Roseiarcus sp.]|nr:type II toxin-antitoxin system prevent-host-death family antitoxin [Roseiarcus sp.]